MDVELLQKLSLAGYILGAVFFVLAIILFIVFKVPRLFDDITGRTAKKAIENIRKQNESTGNKAYKPSVVNLERGKLTDKINKLSKEDKDFFFSNVGVGTEELQNNNVNELNVFDKGGNETTLLEPQANETTLLEPQANETTLLDQQVNETTLLDQTINETTLLEQQVNELASKQQELGHTAILSHEEIQAALRENNNAKNVGELFGGDFSVEVEMAFTDSNEIIE